MKHEYVLGIVAAVCVAACGGAPPRDALTAAEKAISAAEVGGADENPKAQLHLKHARDGVAEAKRLMEDGDNDRAAMVIERAQIDAEVALASAQKDKARTEADQLLAEVEKLKKRMEDK